MNLVALSRIISICKIHSIFFQKQLLRYSSIYDTLLDILFRALLHSIRPFRGSRFFAIG